MLLPMLSIYQEYVRNHHYSLQVRKDFKNDSIVVCILLTSLESVHLNI